MFRSDGRCLFFPGAIRSVAGAHGQDVEVQFFCSEGQKISKGRAISKFSCIAVSEYICGTNVVQIFKIERGHVKHSHNHLIFIG
jgi:hypothetical protein